MSHIHAFTRAYLGMPKLVSTVIETLNTNELTNYQFSFIMINSEGRPVRCSYDNHNKL